MKRRSYLLEKRGLFEKTALARFYLVNTQAIKGPKYLRKSKLREGKS